MTNSNLNITSNISRKKTIFKIRSKHSWDKLSKSHFVSHKNIWAKYYFEDNSLKNNIKIAIAVPRKYGNAIKRNLLKRRIKEITRLKIQSTDQYDSFVILFGINKRLDNEISFQELKESIESILDDINQKKTNDQ